VRLHLRPTAALAAAALALGTGLVAAGPATAENLSTPSAAATFDSVSITGLKNKITVPKYGKYRTVSFTANITGTASDGGTTDVNGDGLSIDYKAYDADFYGPKIVNLKTKASSASDIFVTAPQTVTTGANTFTFRISYSTAPGLYEVRLPITQNDWTTSPRVSTTKTATFRFKIFANKTVSKKMTSASAPSWRPGATAKFTVRAPAYQKGAKVTMFYKTAKAKKFTKVVAGKLKVKPKKSTYSSIVVLKTKKLRPGHKIYFTIGKTTWAPKYQTKKTKIVRL